MNLKSKLTITKLVATIALFALAAFAHGGFDHVMGTVAKVTGSVLTVKTAKGDVDVTLGEKTAFTKNNQKAQLVDLTPGVRVVVDVPTGSKEKLAQSVKIGAAAAGHETAGHDAHNHDAHK